MSHLIALLTIMVASVPLIQSEFQHDRPYHLSEEELDEDDEDAWVEWDEATIEHGDGDPSLSSVAELKPEQLSIEQTQNNVQDQQELGNVISQEEAAGFMGAPYVIEDPSPNEKLLIDEGYKRHAFNEYISDRIPLRRSLPDYRNHWCRKPGLYLDNLLAASVIMCFHNEALSVLLRSVHSILDRTPAHLLAEIVLVDDNSEYENLKQPLDEYIQDLPKVKVVRSEQRLGLIRARILGADNAQGPILVFLDSHIEVTPGWLEPMADRITRDWRNVVCPIIDVIDYDTLEYRMSERSVTAVGGFSWDMIFTWKTATDDVLASLNTPADPVPSPTMAGGLFAIHKEFFNYLGKYDDEYEIWGAENLEISFKAWMCGGRLEIVPCSHIGHIYRKRSPYSRNGTEQRPHRNYIRLAAVWLDDYAKFYYQRIGNNLGDYGDITPRLELKERLQCKSFEWFIQNIYPDVFNPKKVVAEGEIRSEAFGGKSCLDSFSNIKFDKSTKKSLTKPFMWPCHNSGGNQHWYLTQDGELRRDESCLDYSGTGASGLSMYPCHKHKGNQLWVYDTNNGFIMHVVSELCLMLESRDKLSLGPCEERITHRWKIRKVNLKRTKKLLLMTNEYMQRLHA